MNLKIKRNIFKTVILFPVCLLALVSCGGSGDTDDTLYLRVYNSGDYIYENDPANGYDEPDLTDQYEEWINEEENKKLYFGEDFDKDIEIIYDTFDVNETMYNEVLTGKTNYDLICTSDYMVQKMVKNDLILEIDKSRVPNYEEYASDFLVGEEGKLEAVAIYEDDPDFGTLNDYCVGYMWGTLGILFNPEYEGITNRTKEEVIEDFTSPDGWDTLWDKSEYYLGCTSIKDSMRDAYAMGIAHALVDSEGNNEFEKLYEEYEGNYGDEYNEKLTELFNKCDDETIELVKDALIELKDYIYGFEVDTGKTDIITGKIGINLAWSGDATYSMDTAEEEDYELYYAIPSYISNLWMDTFVIMKDIDDDHVSAAYSFLDFVSDPEIAALNMDYVGYTPFVGGDAIYEQVLDWYDMSEEEDVDIDELYEYDLTYFFANDEDDEEEYVVYVEEEQINRQMRAQYPLESDIPHLAIMKDFGDQNAKITSMWENVKINALPTALTVIIILAVILFIGFLFGYKYIRVYKAKLRKKYRVEVEE